MSLPDYSLVLSAAAQDDFEDIISYTLQTWGNQQASEYALLVDSGLNTIKDNPGLGHGRSELRAGYRCFHAGQHLILYRVEGAIVYVVRILHGRMDIHRHMDGE